LGGFYEGAFFPPNPSKKPFKKCVIRLLATSFEGFARRNDKTDAGLTVWSADFGLALTEPQGKTPRKLGLFSRELSGLKGR
jgi:hypothetical protein